MLGSLAARGGLLKEGGCEMEELEASRTEGSG